MRQTRLLGITVLVLTLGGCVAEDYFGLSQYGRIKSIELSNQASASKILEDSLLIRIPFPPGVDISNITVRSIELSSFATATIEVGDVLDMNVEQRVTVTSEDGTPTEWTIVAEVAGANPQLANADFELWYETSGGYFEPGESAQTTIWGTGNPGTQLLDITATTPFELTDQTNAARMETYYNGSLPAAFGTPISAGSIFVGVFNVDNIDPSNPRAAIDFGSPFSGRPDAFTIDYQYNPGTDNQDKNQDPLPYPDACDIYVLLEIRGQSGVRRLGTGWFRSSDPQEDMTEIEVPITYGPLDDSFPDFMKPADGKYVLADSAEFAIPTHLTFVASSSFDGDNFAGAVGSVLFIDNLQLVYD